MKFSCDSFALRSDGFRTLDFARSKHDHFYRRLVPRMRMRVRLLSSLRRSPEESGSINLVRVSSRRLGCVRMLITHRVRPLGDIRIKREEERACLSRAR